MPFAVKRVGAVRGKKVDVICNKGADAICNKGANAVSGKRALAVGGPGFDAFAGRNLMPLAARKFDVCGKGVRGCCLRQRRPLSCSRHGIFGLSILRRDTSPVGSGRFLSTRWPGVGACNLAGAQTWSLSQAWRDGWWDSLHF